MLIQPISLKKLFRVVSVLVLYTANCVKAVDLSTFVKETQVVDSSNGKMTMIWWTPKSYWRFALTDNSQLSESAKETIASVFEKRIVVGVIRMDVSPLGEFSRSKENDEGEVISCSYNGMSLKRLSVNDIDAESRDLLVSMKPGLARALGQIGEGLEFYCFENPMYENGNLVEDTEGRIEFSAYGKKARFRLPLAAKLPPIVDSKTGDSFPGNYKFNPYTGERIVESLGHSLRNAYFDFFVGNRSTVLEFVSSSGDKRFSASDTSKGYYEDEGRKFVIEAVGSSPDAPALLIKTKSVWTMESDHFVCRESTEAGLIATYKMIVVNDREAHIEGYKQDGIVIKRRCTFSEGKIKIAGEFVSRDGEILASFTGKSE